MQATTEFLYRVFDTYNKRCFESSLQRPLIVITRAKRQLGLFAATRPTPTIKVSNYYDRSEAEYTDTMVHEMIHYYIFANHIRDTGPHGKYFHTLMQEINRKEGLNMSVRTSSLQWKPASNALKMRHVLFMKFNDGKHFISVVSPRYVYHIEQQLKRMGQHVALHRWFVTNHPDYQSFSIVRTLRGRPVTPEEFTRRLEEMTLTCTKSTDEESSRKTPTTPII